MIRKHLLNGLILVLLGSSCATMKKYESLKPGDPFFLEKLMKQDAGVFSTILENPAEYKVQIIFTQVDRKKNNKPVFTDHYFNVNDSNYFYPASTVKFPVALLALQKLNELKIKGLGRNTTMITETGYAGQSSVYNDPTSPDGRPTIGHYIKKIFLVSDNDASNRLYEFLGQEYINNTLKEMGYTGTQLIHRLDIALSEEENRNTNPVHFLDSSGKTIFFKPAERSELLYDKRDTRLGKGFYSRGELKNEPFDFSKKNRLTLTSMHRMMRAVMFPNTVQKKQRFNLTKDDYNFLRKYMSMFSDESKYPSYDTSNYGPNYIKFILAGGAKERVSPGIRILNKSGQAYGFLTDIVYLIDPVNNVEFFVTATIHCNSDSIYNDDHYDYDRIGFPFMKNLGKLLYEHELKRQKRYKPDLSEFQFDYNE